MANFTKAFRDEVARLTRRALSTELGQLKHAGAQHRRDLAWLKRDNAKLLRKVAFLEKQEARRVADAPEAPAASARTVRYSAAWLKKHRDKIGFSAEDYAKLIGCSAQSIYMWEQGKTKPRAAQLTKLAAIRGIRRREAESMLALVNKKK
ncbi:MAG: helix-turn-helix transcriptional regulator [Phycisphaeraceae bacterium]